MLVLIVESAIVKSSEKSIFVILFTLLTQGCATTAQLYIDPHYKILPDRSYPELQIGMKINVGPKITFKKKERQIAAPIVN